MMIVNKKGLALLALISFFSISSTPAKAADVVPPLYGIDDIVVNLTRLGNEAHSTQCSVFRRQISDQILEALLDKKIPARSSIGKPLAEEEKTSVELVPELVTISARENKCVSWIAFSVQSRNAISLPPAKYHREVQLTYWKGGLLVSTSKLPHNKGVKDAVEKLVEQFIKQYHKDQPPKL